MKHLKDRGGKIKSNKKVFYSILGGTGVVVLATAVAVPFILSKKNGEQESLSPGTINPAPRPESKFLSRGEEYQKLVKLADTLDLVKLRLPIEVYDPIKRSQNFADEIDFSNIESDYTDKTTGVVMRLRESIISDDGTKLTLQFIFKLDESYNHKDFQYYKTLVVDGYLPKVVVKDTITKANARAILRSFARDPKPEELEFALVNELFNEIVLTYSRDRDILDEELYRVSETNVAATTIRVIKQIKKKIAKLEQDFMDYKNNLPTIANHLKNFITPEAIGTIIKIGDIEIREGKYVARVGEPPFLHWKERIDKAIEAGCEVTVTEVERTDKKFVVNLAIKKGGYLDNKKISFQHWTR